MNAWSFYDERTGVFTGLVLQASDDGTVAMNTPEGCRAMPGAWDAHTQRVAVETPAPQDAKVWLPPVVDYRPPQPEGDEFVGWAWDEAALRWMLQPTGKAVQLLQAKALRDAILEQEAAQARPARELLMALVAGQPAPAAALQKLAAIEQAVAPLRQQMQDAVAAARLPADDGAGRGRVLE